MRVRGVRFMTYRSLNVLNVVLAALVVLLAIAQPADAEILMPPDDPEVPAYVAPPEVMPTMPDGIVESLEQLERPLVVIERVLGLSAQSRDLTQAVQAAGSALIGRLLLVETLRLQIECCRLRQLAPLLSAICARFECGR